MQRSDGVADLQGVHPPIPADVLVLELPRTRFRIYPGSAVNEVLLDVVEFAASSCGIELVELRVTRDHTELLLRDPRGQVQLFLRRFREVADLAIADVIGRESGLIAASVASECAVDRPDDVDVDAGPGALSTTVEPRPP